MQTALSQAEKIGYNRVTREVVAKHVPCAPSLVSHYWGTVEQLQKSILREAVKSKNLKIIAQGLVSRSPITRRVPMEIKQAALQTLTA